MDLSDSLIASDRTRVPTAEFRVESFLQTDIPPCHAVTSMGECLNYLFDPQNNLDTLFQRFERIYNGLAPGGVIDF